VPRRFVLSTGTGTSEATTTDYDVRTYGAAGDGVTDDTVAIQAALNAVPEDGGEVVLPVAGRYMVSQIQIKSNTTFRAVAGAVIVRGTFTDDDLEPQAATVINADTVGGNENIHLIGIEVQLASAEQDGRPITFMNVDNITLEAVSVTGPRCYGWATTFFNCTSVRVNRYYQNCGTTYGEDGLHFVGGQDINVADCEIHSGDDCISFTRHLDDYGTMGISDVTITNIVCESQGARILALDISSDFEDDVVFERFTVSNLVGRHGAVNNMGLSIRQQSATASEIRDITISNVTMDCSLNPDADGFLGQGVLLENVSNIRLTNVTMTDTASHCFEIAGCDNITLDNCFANGARNSPFSRGFLIYDCTRLRLFGCRAINTPATPFQIGVLSSTTCDDVILLDCEHLSGSTNATPFSFALQGTDFRLISCRSTLGTVGSDPGEGGVTAVFNDCLFVGDPANVTLSAGVHGTGTKLGFYTTAPVAKQTGVAVTAAGVHAALVALGLIAA
jgi:polygalacturonase